MERCLPCVSLLDSDEMVAVLKVYFVEIFCTSISFLELIHVGEGVTIGDSNLVDCSIVNAQA